MSEALQSFEHAVDRYVQSLRAFTFAHDLPQNWFLEPDHLAVKCLDAGHYEDTLAAWLPHANLASYTYLNGRRLASVHLDREISLGSFGNVAWLEIMEPRPDRVGKDIVGIDHVEFMFPDFAEAETALQSEQIAYEFQENPNHQWLSVPINPQGQELKLNDRPLAEIVATEIREGKAYVL